MKYFIGQAIGLWEVYPSPVDKKVIIAREILVSITDIRENVPGEFSREPTGTGLKGIGDDGKLYEKHWDSYPEAQLSDFSYEWSDREDGTTDPDFPYWRPQESAPFHSSVYRNNIRLNVEFTIVDKDGNPIEPKGDLEKCSEHGTFHYPGAKCVSCSLARLRLIPVTVS